jgi:hypothetical protein
MRASITEAPGRERLTEGFRWRKRETLPSFAPRDVAEPGSHRPTVARQAIEIHRDGCRHICILPPMEETTINGRRFRVGTRRDGTTIPVPIPGPEDQAKSMEARRKLQPSAQRKRDLTGERLRMVEETTERIKSVLFEENITYAELARRMGMSRGHIGHILGGSRNMTLATLADIAEAVGYRFTLIPHKVEEGES